METANRFARDLIVQETGYAMLKARAALTWSRPISPMRSLDDTPTANLIRQVLGAVSEFEKAMVVSKLKGARDRKRATGIKVEGRKSYREINPGDGADRETSPPLSGPRPAPIAEGGFNRPRRSGLCHGSGEALRCSCCGEDNSVMR